MNLNDTINFTGHFSITAYKKDGTVEEYEDKNLIMDRARQNMAQLVGGVTAGNERQKGKEINKFVLGTMGHVDDDLLNPKKVGGSEGFNATRTELFSEEDDDGEYYVIPFNVKGDNDVEDSTDDCYNNKKPDDKETCKVRRTVSDRTTTYTITIGDSEGNSSSDDTSVIAYTEAALYAGDDIFSMKTFPARVKEDTVKLIIKWSIIF